MKRYFVISLWVLMIGALVLSRYVGSAHRSFELVTAEFTFSKAQADWCGRGKDCRWITSLPIIIVVSNPYTKIYRSDPSSGVAGIKLVVQRSDHLFLKNWDEEVYFVLPSATRYEVRVMHRKAFGRSVRVLKIINVAG